MEVKYWNFKITYHTDLKNVYTYLFPMRNMCIYIYFYIVILVILGSARSILVSELL